MKRGRLPLTALRSFEAAARRLSFTLAAQDLFVSQAAISRQIRELESLVGQPLFHRGHRSIALTPAGERLIAVIGPAFDAIDVELSELAGQRQAEAIGISAEPSFAACWLVPHLPRFRALYPDIDVTIDADSRLSTFRRGEPELAVRFSETRNSWPRSETRPLYRETLIPVAAPAIAARVKAAGSLSRETLLHTENRVDWPRWITASGLPMVPDVGRGPVFADTALALQAAVRSQGVALIDRLLATEDLAAGHVVPLFEHTVPGGNFFLVARDFAKLAPPARLLAEWIEAAFVTSTNQSPAMPSSSASSAFR